MKLTEKKRQDILDAAIEEFRNQGFTNAKITHIAKLAQVSSRTLYNHFETKEALFDAVCQIMLAKNSAMEPVPYDPNRDIAEQLVDALKSYISVITQPESIGLQRVVISEFLRDIERSKVFFTEAASHDYPLTLLIEQAMLAGVLKQAPPEYATGQLLALIKNFFYWPEFLLGESLAPETVMEDCVAMFLAHYSN